MTICVIYTANGVICAGEKAFFVLVNYRYTVLSDTSVSAVLLETAFSDNLAPCGLRGCKNRAHSVS